MLACLGGACGDTETSAGPPGDMNEPDDRPGPDDTEPTPRADAGEDSGPAVVPFTPFDINHVLSTGQSNSVGNDAVAALSTTQPYDNLMFDVGVITASQCGGDGCTAYDTPNGFVDLVENDIFFPYYDQPVETMSSALANQTSKIAKAQSKAHAMLVSIHGRSGREYACLRKGSCGYLNDDVPPYIDAFADGMRQVEDAKRLADAANKTYVVRAVTAIHGEADHDNETIGDSSFPLTGTGGTGTIRNYKEALLEWQRDYEAGVKERTGQTIPVPMFLNQLSHWRYGYVDPPYANPTPTTSIALLQLDAHVESKGKVVVVGPTYQLDYAELDEVDACLHFTNASERHLGEYFAKAYSRMILEGRPWEPLRPSAVTIAGNVVTAKFIVPSPPLVFDTTRVEEADHMGFEWHDSSINPPTITNVTRIGDDTVQITLSSAPTGGDKRLRYAFTSDGCHSNFDGTARTGARGNLRDSDTTPSENGLELFNWAVHFDVPIP